ncbi:Alanyl-tRNA synthetase [Mycena venus]|uniref:Alanyl-tRNA synthetase n=1 Tax=Mycena venus TaxID=2733690 RepID=A0A8H7DD25_9AGAR|nr:Alanyl-tRNA synthetase [Mycena venus]
MDSGWGHDHAFAKTDREAEAGSPASPTYPQGPLKLKTVYRKNEVVQEIAYGTPGPDTEGPFSRYCAANSVIWKLYMLQAKTFNDNLATSLNSDLDPLLIFAGLFSAILTAFLIESRKDLQADPQNTTNSLLAFLIQDLHNSAGPFSPPPTPRFTPTLSSRWVNGLWFASLVLSLMSALGASLAKGWGTQFSSTIVGSSWNDAKLHCGRLRGLKRWHLHLIVQCLPILIHIAFFLFSIGLVILLFGDDGSIGVSICVLTVLVAFLYIGSSIHPAFYPDSPFRTPVSGMIRSVLRGSWRLQKIPGFPEEAHAQKAQALAWLLSESQATEAINATVYAIAGLVANPGTQDQLLCRPTVDVLSRMLSTELARRSGNEDLLEACLYALLRLVQCAPADGEEPYVLGPLRTLATSGALSDMNSIPTNLRPIARCVKCRIILLLGDDKLRHATVLEPDISSLIKSSTDPYLRRLLSEVHLLLSGFGNTNQGPCVPQSLDFLRILGDRHHPDLNEVHAELIRAADAKACLVGGITDDFVSTLLDGLMHGPTDHGRKYAKLFAELTVDAVFRQQLETRASGKQICSLITWEDNEGRKHIYKALENFCADVSGRKLIAEGLSGILGNIDVHNPQVLCDIVGFLAVVATYDEMRQVIKTTDITNFSAGLSKLARMTPAFENMTEEIVKWAGCDNIRTFVVTPDMCLAIAGLLQDSHKSVRECGLQMLMAFLEHDDTREIATAAMCQVINGMLEDIDRRLRNSALQMLSEFLKRGDNWASIGTRATCQRVVGLLADSDKDVRDLAMDTLMIFLEHDITCASIATTAMCQIIAGMLADSDEHVRDSALQKLIKLSEQDDIRESIATPAICRNVPGMLKDSSELVRSSTLRTLITFSEYDLSRASIATPATRQMIPEILLDSDPNVRNFALQVLMAFSKHGEFKLPKTTFLPVVGMLHDSDWSVRKYALRTLSAFSEQDNTRALVATSAICERIAGMLKDSEWFVCNSALQTLVTFLKHDDIRAPSATPAMCQVLKAMLADSNGDTHTPVPDSLSDDSRTTIVTLDMCNGVNRMLKDLSPYVRNCALQALTTFLRHTDDIRKLIGTPTIYEVIAQMLADPDDNIRDSALQRLISVSESDNIRASIATLPMCLMVAGMLKDPSMNVRHSAVQVLTTLLKYNDLQESISTQAIFEVVAALLAHSDEDVRDCALHTLVVYATHNVNLASIASAAMYVNLSSIAGSAMCEVIVKMLEVLDRDVCQCAMQTLLTLLAHNDTRSLIATLAMYQKVAGMLTNPDEGIRESALLTLMAFWQHYDIRILIITPAVCQTVIEMLKEPWLPARRSALHILTLLLDHDNIRTLVATPITYQAIHEMLDDPNKDIRNSALQTLMEFLTHDISRMSIITPTMYQKISGMLVDSYWVVRRSALQILSSFLEHDDIRASSAAASVCPVIVAMLADPDEEVRNSAIDTLMAYWRHDVNTASIAGRDVRKSITGMLADPTEGVRKFALQALTTFSEYHNTRISIATPAMCQVIPGILEDPDPNVRNCTLHTLTAFAKHGEIVPLDAFFLPNHAPDDTRALIATPAISKVIPRILGDSDPNVRNSALHTLMAFSQYDETRTFIAAPALCQVIAGMLAHSDWSVRKSALQALHETRECISSLSMCQIIIGMLSDSDEDVRRSALQTLSVFADHDDTRASIATLAICQGVAGMIQDTSLYVRICALQTLTSFLRHDNIRASIAIPVMREAITAALADSDRSVHKFALQTLSALSEQEDTRVSIATPVMCQVLVGLLEDPDEDVCSFVLQTLTAFLNHGDARASLTAREPSRQIFGLLVHSRPATRQCALKLLNCLLQHDDCALAILSPTSVKHVVRLLSGNAADIEILELIKALVFQRIKSLP